MELLHTVEILRKLRGNLHCRKPQPCPRACAGYTPPTRQRDLDDENQAPICPVSVLNREIGIGDVPDIRWNRCRRQTSPCNVGL